MHIKTNLKLDFKSSVKWNTIHKCPHTVHLFQNTLQYERLIHLFCFSFFFWAKTNLSLFCKFGSSTIRCVNIFKGDLLYVLCYVVGLVSSDCCFSLDWTALFYTEFVCLCCYQVWLFVCTVLFGSDVCLSALCCLIVMCVCLHCVVW